VKCDGVLHQDVRMPYHNPQWKEKKRSERVHAVWYSAGTRSVLQWLIVQQPAVNIVNGKKKVDHPIFYLRNGF